MGDENPRRTLGDYSRPSHEGYRNTIEVPNGNDCTSSIRHHPVGAKRMPIPRTSEDLTTHFLAQFFPPGRTSKHRNDILMFQQHQGESLSEAWTRFKDLLQKVPQHGIDLWLQTQIFYDHVNPITRRTIDQAAGGKLRDKNDKESWALLEDLALYDNESWNDPRDFAKPVKAISMPHDVTSESDRHLIELKNQIQSMMEAHLSQSKPVQVNKIASIDYASTQGNGVECKLFATNQGPRTFNEAAHAWKDKPHFVKKERESRHTTPREHEGLSSEVDDEVGSNKFEEEEEADLEYFNTFPFMKELEYHEWKYLMDMRAENFEREKNNSLQLVETASGFSRRCPPPVIFDKENPGSS
ncbi:zinc finger, CCHC-type containing protein [Tanacetum coccineum]